MSYRRTAFFLLAVCLFMAGTLSCRRSADFTGFWKANCTDDFGLQIKKQSGNLFSVSFCGPGGCFAPGEWTPNTPIVGDPKYRVVKATTIERERTDGGWDRWTKCNSDTNPVLASATKPAPRTAESSDNTTLLEPNQASPDYANQSPTGPGQRSGGWKGANQSVYVVTHNHYAEGFTPEGQTAQFGDLIAIQILNPESQPSTNKDGERLSLFVGAQKQGYVTVQKVMPFQCDSSAALVSADSAVPLTKDTMALASNSKTIRPHTDFRRQPSAQEREYGQELAMKELRNHGVQGLSARSITLDQLIVTKLDGSDSNFIVGSLSVRVKDVLHEVFLIGKIHDSTATTELARYHKTTDLENGTDSEDFRLVDQLDLDGDGVDELVVEVRGYENEEFRIYSRHNGVWRQVQVGGEGGC